MNQSRPPSLTPQVVAIPRCDRWQVAQRLLELAIPCEVSPEGHLCVDIHDPVSAVQFRSVLQQFTCDRQTLLSWLKQCYKAG